MAKTKNPFIVTGKISSKYFCDRKAETASLTKSLDNGNNLVLISPRRMGKTGLIRHCYDESSYADDYYTFFIDILHTTSLQEFTYLFGRRIFDGLASIGSKMLTAFVRTLKSLNGQFGFDSMTGLPTFSLSLGDIHQPEMTLEEIFQYLDNADKPCIVTFDEFQQINNYPEKNVEALLRTYIQHMSNCQFIFAGSEYHIMQEMFLSSAHPFYSSADILELKPINKDVYAGFVESWMTTYDRSIDRDVIFDVYDLFHGNTYGMQKTFNELFAMTQQGDNITIDTVEYAVNNIIDQKEPLFEEMLSNIPEKQKPLLYAIANEGETGGITSSAFIKKYSLVSASSNQYVAGQLMGSGIVTRINGRYSITEQFFDIWVNRIYGNKSLRRQLMEIDENRNGQSKDNKDKQG